MSQPTTTASSPSADHEMDNAFADEFTEESMLSPEKREDLSHDQRMDPVAAEGESQQAGIPRAGGEPDFDDDADAKKAVDADDDDDDEEEDTTA